MMKFSWRQAQDQERALPDRFADLPGATIWRQLLTDTVNAGDNPEDLYRAFDRFIRAIDQTDAALAKDCVFISHRRADWQRAEDIAKLVDSKGRDYWLDIHDPTLQWASKQFTGAAAAVLLAAIIELALLNSTHVIALHTTNSRGSVWIPYELGRAKARKIYSSQSAGWFDRPSVSPDKCGEYVYLGHQTFSDQDILDWLN